MNPGAVILDLDDTLIVEESTARASLLEATAMAEGLDPIELANTVFETAQDLWRSSAHYSLCVDLGIASWEGLWATFEGNHELLDEIKEWVPNFRQEAWLSALTQLGIEDNDLADEMSSAYIRAQRRGCPLVDGADRAVHLLKSRYKLGLLTNGPADIQQLKLHATGLADCFDVIVISGEIGIGKPDPRAFERVLETLGVEPADAVMVGDSWERDVYGAIGAGLSAIWISNGRSSPGHLLDVISLNRIGDIVGVLI